jgi:pimeloyl-ACP methyl ester carboxylesterase
MPTVSLSQGSMDYREDGEGPAVVLLHGLLVNGTLWRKVVPRLAEHARVIVPELPLGSHSTPMNADADLSTHGIARHVAEFFEKLGVEDVTLVGNDTGGLTSCDTFDNFPPRLFRPLLVLPKIPGALRGVQMLSKFKAVYRSPTGYGWLAKRPIDDDVIRGWLAPGARPEIRRDLAKVLRGIDSADTMRAADKLRSFDKPVLLAWGGDDKFMPLEHARRLAAQVPDGRVEVIPDSYTFTPEDQPDALAAEIAKFIRAESAVAT